MGPTWKSNLWAPKPQDSPKKIEFLIHVYFALIPEHRAFLKSMISGRGPSHARGDHD